MRALPFAALLVMAAVAGGPATAQTAPAADHSAHAAPAQPVTQASPRAALPAATPATYPWFAVAGLWSPTRQNLGVVSAYRGPKGLLFNIEGEDWPEGWHGVHLHAVGSCEGPAFTSAGAHLNHADPQAPHGLLNTEGGPDLGDLQNVYAGADGKVRAEVYAPTTEIDLLDADGTAFVIHANKDDHKTQPIGGAGDRIACGVFETPSVITGS